MTLAQENCEVCRVGAPTVTPEDMPSLLQEIPQWRLEPIEGVAQLTRTFEFSNFKEAIAFTNKVADIAEAAQHHPAVLTEWGKVSVRWWTHKIAGVHRNDFIMAARTDALFV